MREGQSILWAGLSERMAAGETGEPWDHCEAVRPQYGPINRPETPVPALQHLLQGCEPHAVGFRTRSTPFRLGRHQTQSLGSAHTLRRRTSTPACAIAYTRLVLCVTLARLQVSVLFAGVCVTARSCMLQLLNRVWGGCSPGRRRTSSAPWLPGLVLCCDPAFDGRAALSGSWWRGTKWWQANRRKKGQARLLDGPGFLCCAGSSRFWDTLQELLYQGGA